LTVEAGIESVPEKGRVWMMKNENVDPKDKGKREKYVPPALVDYGNVAKITSAPKAISGPDAPGAAKKGHCL
jgi:hypothetical protein